MNFGSVKNIQRPYLITKYYVSRSNFYQRIDFDCQNYRFNTFKAINEVFENNLLNYKILKAKMHFTAITKHKMSFRVIISFN